MRCLRCSLDYGPEKRYCERCGRALSRPLGTGGTTELQHHDESRETEYLYSTGSPPRTSGAGARVVASPTVAAPPKTAHVEAFTVASPTIAVAERLVPQPLGDSSQWADLYRQVYVSLDPPRDARQFVIGVTSAIAGEGRTTVALNLANTLATDLDLRVTLVEADLERPTLAERFHIPSVPGLAEVLREQCRLIDVMRPVEANLSVVPCGTAGREVNRLLRRMPQLNPFRDPQGPSGLLILDLPPVINQGYGALAAGAADVVVLVVRAGVTPIKVVREAIARLEQNPPQGVIFNAPRNSLPSWWPGNG